MGWKRVSWCWGVCFFEFLKFYAIVFLKVNWETLGWDFGEWLEMDKNLKPCQAAIWSDLQVSSDFCLSFLLSVKVIF